MNSWEGFNIDPGPRQEHVVFLPQRNRVVMQPLFSPFERNEDLRRESDLMETYDEMELEATREDSPSLSSEPKGRPPGETMVVEPMMVTWTEYV